MSHAAPVLATEVTTGDIVMLVTILLLMVVTDLPGRWPRRR